MTFRGKRHALLSLFFCMSLCMSGCQKQEVIDKEVAIQSDTTKSVTYELTQVTRGPVQCTYKQIAEQELSFEIDQELITEVLVEKGDSVKKGEVLASVNVDETKKKAEALQYDIAVNELALQQAIERRDFELAQEELWYEGYTTKKKEDKEALTEAKENIEKSYGKKIQSIEDSLYFQRKRLEEYEAYIENGELKAPISGIISHVMSDLKGTLTVKGESVIRMYDPESKMYYSDDVEAIPYLQEGMEYTIVCGLGKMQREYTVVPANMENWGELVYFKLLDEDYDPNNVVLGKITLVIDEKEDALRLDDNAIHSSGDEYYVYTLDENNVRRMQFVEVGLWGDGTVEIISGLSEGDRVILK